MGEPKVKLGGGLRELPRDGRDFKFGQTFGFKTDPKTLPSSFMVGEVHYVKDQQDTDMCVAYATCGVSELQEEIRLSPEFQFAKIKELEGNWKGWGADLRQGCQSLIKKGSLEAKAAPYHLEGSDRNFLANWLNWPSHLDDLAKKHAKETYFDVTGPYDIYDNFRLSMWESKEEKRGILTGVKWRPEWTYAAKGVIPSQFGMNGFLHAIAIVGWNQVGLIAQLSNGINIGNQGFFYFPREIVNKEFVYGAFIFRDLPKDVAKFLNEKRLSVNDVWSVKMWLKYVALIKKIKSYFK